MRRLHLLGHIVATDALLFNRCLSKAEVPDFKAMRRLPANSDFIALQLGNEYLRIELHHQRIISYRVVEALEPLDLGPSQLRFVLLGKDFIQS